MEACNGSQQFWSNVEKVTQFFGTWGSTFDLQVGKQNEALETLHHAILHKRWKNQWFEPLPVCFLFLSFKTLNHFFFDFLLVEMLDIWH